MGWSSRRRDSKYTESHFNKEESQGKKDSFCSTVPRVPRARYVAGDFAVSLLLWYTVQGMVW